MNKRRSHTGLAAAPAAAVLGVVASLAAAPGIASAHTQRDDSDAHVRHGADNDEQSTQVKVRQSDSDDRESAQHTKATSRRDADSGAAGSAEVSVGGRHRASTESGTEETNHAAGSNVGKSSEENADDASPVVAGHTATNRKLCPDAAGGDAQNSNLTEEELAYAGPHMHVLSKGHAAAQDERSETGNENAYGHGQAKGDARTHADGHTNGHVNAHANGHVNAHANDHAGGENEQGEAGAESNAFGHGHAQSQANAHTKSHANAHTEGQVNAHTNGDVKASTKSHAGSAGEQADTGEKPYLHGPVGGGVLGAGTLTAGAHRKQGSAGVGALTGGAQGGAHVKGGPGGLGTLTAANHGTAQVGQDTATAANSAFNTKAGAAAGVNAGTTTGTTAGTAGAGTDAEAGAVTGAQVGTTSGAQTSNAAATGAAGVLPQTGADDNYMLLLASGSALALAGGGVLLYRRRFGASA